MKSTIAAVGLLASLASASAHQPRHFHWRRDNSTASAGFTTLTVQITEVATVTSCAPTITNCPARSATLSASDLHTYVITNTVVLTETVCPVTEAASISKSLVNQHATGGLPGSTLTVPAVTTPTAAPSVPLNTAGVTKSAQDAAVTSPPTAGGNGESDDEDDCPAEDGDVVTTVTQIISTKTLTMTVGKGSTASVVTTAIPTTIESTILVTKPAAAATSLAGAVGTEEPTTTVTATSTNTRTVTVKRPNPTGAGSPGSGTGSPGSGTGIGAEAECSCPAAVTVTLPASTVYVTIGGSAPTSAAAAPTSAAAADAAAANAASSVTTSAPAAAAITGGANAGGENSDDSDDDSDDEDDCPAEDDVVTMSTTVLVAPYPTNGTASTGAAKPTGLKRSNKLF